MKMLKQFFLLILLFPLFNSCIWEDTKPYEATYEVNVLTDVPLKLMISYYDAGECVVFHTTEKHWSKKVTLSSREIASLLVKISYSDSEENIVFPFDSRTLVSGKITAGEKTVSEYSENLIMIALSKHE